MLNDHQLRVAELRIRRRVRRLSERNRALDPHVFDDHLREIRTLQRQLGGTRKHLANVMKGRGPVRFDKSSVGTSRTHIGRLERTLVSYLVALVARAPDRPKTWKAVQLEAAAPGESIHAEVLTGKGVINVVQKVMKQFDHTQLTTQVRLDLQNGQQFIHNAQPQQLDTVTGLLMMIAAVLETLRMRGFFKRSA